MTYDPHSILLLQLRQLESSIAAQRDGLQISHEPGDQIDVQSSLENRAEAGAIVHRLTLEQRRVAAALKRIDSGTYGECLNCDEQIPEARLRAIPSAELCIVCQEAAERVGRAADGAQWEEVR